MLIWKYEFIFCYFYSSFFDVELISNIITQVNDQQSTLQKAGVPGFYVTENPKEIKIQMFLLDFILRLSRLKYEPGK